MTFTEILTFILAGAAVAGIFVYGLAGKAKSSTVSAVVIENTSLRNQINDVTNDRNIWKTRAEKAEENEQYLKDLAQSKPDFNKVVESNTILSVQLTTQHKEILATFKKLTGGLTKLATTMAKEKK
jgi:hypothetical protein